MKSSDELAAVPSLAPGGERLRRTFPPTKLLRNKILPLLAAYFVTALSIDGDAAAAERARLLAEAKSWGYQLQKVEPDEIAACPYDMVVIDYSRDGSDELAFTREEVARMQRKPDGSRRIVLSYLSIGEAETYRSYWRWYWGWFFGLLAPSWRGGQNTEWRGNYAVRYWMDDWQDIIFKGQNSYLDRIIKAGFDGAYLDKVDEYEEKRIARTNGNARADMIALVKAVAAHARAREPGFLIVPQNGEELLADQSYRASIDGIGKEDLVFGETRTGRTNSPEEIRTKLEYLQLLRRDGKLVFAVEYLDSPEQIARARAQLVAYGFVPYFADRALDNLRIGDLPAAKR
jgi:cysteinyl-tRNA synthetase